MKQWIRLFAAIGLIVAVSACAPAPPDEGAVVGKEALREYVRASVSAQGDVGYLIEKTQFSFTDASVVDTWNNNPPEKTPADTAPG